MKTTVTTNSNRVRNNRRRRNRRTGQATDEIKFKDTFHESSPKIGIQAKLSNCAVTYAKALVNPFQNISPLPCIPDVLVLPSMKYKVQARGTFTSAGISTAFVAMNPERFLFNNSANSPIQYTGVGYLSDGNVLIDGAGTFNTAGGSSFNVGAPSIINGTTQFRCVGAGIKIRYIGTTLNQGGSVTLYRSPGEYLAAGTYPVATFRQQQTTGTAPVTRQWECITYVPDDPDQLAYMSLNELNDRSGNGTYSLFAAITGTTAGNSFEFEAVGYYELVGIAATQPSRSHSDPVGMGAIISSLPTKIPATSPNRQEQSVMMSAARYLLDNVSTVLPVIGNAAKLGLSAYTYYNQPSRTPLQIGNKQTAYIEDVSDD